MLVFLQLVSQLFLCVLLDALYSQLKNIFFFLAIICIQSQLDCNSFHVYYKNEDIEDRFFLEVNDQIIVVHIVFSKIQQDELNYYAIHGFKLLCRINFTYYCAITCFNYKLLLKMTFKINVVVLKINELKLTYCIAEILPQMICADLSHLI